MGVKIYKVFLNSLVATSWNAFAGDIVVKSRDAIKSLVATSWNAFAGNIVVKSRDAIKLHQEKYNVNSLIPQNVLTSDYLTDCHQALFFRTRYSCLSRNII